MGKADLFYDLAKSSGKTQLFSKCWIMPNTAMERQLLREADILKKEGMIIVTESGIGPSGVGVYLQGCFTQEGLKQIQEYKYWEP